VWDRAHPQLRKTCGKRTPFETPAEFVGATRKPWNVLMLERRIEPRSLTLKTGKIVGAADARDIDCAILDLSDGGARILVSDPTEVPQKFLLKVDRTRVTYVCERIWTRGNRIGLSCHCTPAGNVQVAS
jgi:hypothetical protein